MTHAASLTPSVPTSFRASWPVCVPAGERFPSSPINAIGVTAGFPKSPRRPLPTVALIGADGPLQRIGPDERHCQARTDARTSQWGAKNPNPPESVVDRYSALSTQGFASGPGRSGLIGIASESDPCVEGCPSTYTIPGFDAREISQETAPAMTNMPRMTSKHMDTMDELRDSVRQFVGKGKVVSIEEGRMLRLVQAASDEATMLDYAFALLGCGLKENGVFGQRFDQLFREAEAFRAGMIERERGAA